MDFSQLEQHIGYEFKDNSLLEEACRHSSFVNEQMEVGLRDNERLEFLGDAVLNLVIGQMLMQQHPELKEGELSRMRANLVNEAQLAQLAKSIELGSYLYLGKGELQTHGRDKKSILADAYEALIAAVYLDSGFDEVFRFVKRQFASLIDAIATVDADQDYKSRLQEIVQLTHRVMPVYEVVKETGPDHDKTFIVQIELFDTVIRGQGKSKKAAEQDTARNALEFFNLL